MNRRTAMNSMTIMAGAAAMVKVASAADREIEILVGHWKKSKDLTLKVAEAMPEENYDYKPFPEAKTFGGELVHLGQAEGHYLGVFGKGAAPAAPSAATKAATATYLAALFDWSIGTVGQLSTPDLTKTFGNGKMSMTGLDLLYNAMIHTAHTRGYVEMFLRNKGIVPPTYSV
jgi:uncharacterized damage-inducible protein DinB